MFRYLFKINSVAKCKLHLHGSVVLRTNTTVQKQPLIAELKTERFSSLLSGYGFNPGQVSRILKSSELVLHFREDQLLSSLTNWLLFNAGDKLCTTLSTYPELLTLNPDYVNSRCKELMTLFTKKDITKLLVTCPTVFTDEFATIYDKVEYIVHFMGVEQKSIVKSRALLFDLFYIKCRHTILTRTGHYIVKKRSVRSTNPPLDKVFSSNIEKFLKIAKVTEEEYDAFCHCFELEELENQDEDSDMEDDF